MEDMPKKYEDLDEKKANSILKKGFKKAKEILDDDEKTEKFLQKLEKKLKVIPVGGSTLALVPTLASLVRSYIKKEYTEIPMGTIIAIISALAYMIYPGDVIPDIVPGVGFADDAAVILACIKLVGSDVDDYEEWRKKNNKLLDV